MRRFEVRELRPLKLEQLELIGARALLENNKGVWRLAPAFMRELVNRKDPTADSMNELRIKKLEL